jgi:hypothetical protein
VRADCIAGQVPLFQLLIMFRLLINDTFDFIELFSMCSIRSLRIDLQFRTLRRDDKERRTAFQTGRFDVFFELESGAIELP